MPQRAQLRLNGGRYLIDVVMQTQQRFSGSVPGGGRGRVAGIRTCHGAGRVSASGWLLIGDQFP